MPEFLLHLLFLIISTNAHQFLYGEDDIKDLYSSYSHLSVSAAVVSLGGLWFAGVL